MQFNKTHTLIGIIIPMPEESIYLQKNICNPREIVISGIRYTLGKIHNKNIVFVISGLGKINSAAVATRLIQDFQPVLVLLLGSSGCISTTVNKGDVVIGKNVINADFGALSATGVQFQYNEYLSHPQANEHLPLEFTLENDLINSLNKLNKPQLPKIILGNIATSDALPNQKPQIALLHSLGIDVVEMEGAAVMQVCWLFNTACIVIRGVSNNANEPFTQEDIQSSTDNATKVVLEIIKNYIPVLPTTYIDSPEAAAII